MARSVCPGTTSVECLATFTVLQSFSTSEGAEIWNEKFVQLITGPEPPGDTVVKQTSSSSLSDSVRVVSDRNLACAVVIGHETLSDGEVKVYQLQILSYCHTRP